MNTFRVCFLSEPTAHIFCPQPESYSKDQMTEMRDSLLYKEPVDPAHWVGLRKSNDLLDYLRVRSGKIHPLKGVV